MRWGIRKGAPSFVVPENDAITDHDGGMSYGYLYGDTLVNSAQRVFGTAGGSLNSAGFDERATQAGIDGERRVGAILDKLAKSHPGVYVFHAVKLPGHYGDLDHVVLVGSTVIVIDTKNWKSNARYTLRDDDTVYRDGRDFPGGKVKVQQYVDQIRGYTGMKTVGFLAIANRSARIDPDSRSDWDFVNLDGLEKGLAAIIKQERGGFAYAPEQITFLTSRVVDPNFSGSWDVVVGMERRDQDKKRQNAAPAKPVQTEGNLDQIAWWSHFLVFPVFFMIYATSIVQPYSPWRYWLLGAFGLGYGLWVYSHTKYQRWLKGRALVVVGALTLAVTAVVSFSTGVFF